MKLGFPVLSPEGLKSEISDHFGMTEDFIMLETDGDKIVSMLTLQYDPTGGEHKTPAKFIVESGIDILISGGIGPHMLDILLKEGVRVFKGAEGTVQDALEDYKAGMLTEVHSAGDIDS